VQSVVSRNHGLLRKVFKHYSALDSGVDVITTPSEWRVSRAQGTMYLVQFLRMCSDCKLITQHLTIVAIDRLLLAFQDRHESTSVAAYVATDDAATAVKPSPPSKSGSPTSAAVGKTDGDVQPVASSGDLAAEHSEAPHRKPSNSSAASGGRRGTNGGSSRHASLRDNDADKYSRPWDRYRHDLHGFTGELTFREFVEAIVRISAALYRDPVYGSLANRVQLVVDEHLNAFGCQPANGVPVCRLGREHRTTLQKYISPLRHCFDFYALSSAMGSAAFGQGSAGSGTIATANGARVKDTTVTLRQLALMLKKCGLLATAGSSSSSMNGAPLVRLSDVQKAVPFERHEAFMAQIYQKAFIKQHLGQQQQRQQQQSSGLLGVGGGGGGSHGGRDGGASTVGGVTPMSPSSGSHVPRPPPSATPSHAPSAGIAPSGASNAGASPSTHNPAFLSTIHSQAPSVQSGGARDEEAHAAAVAEAEAALANKLAMQTKSLGQGARSFRTTVAMDVELTFAEFVEALAHIATTAFKENTATQRISSMMLNYVLPHEKELPPVEV
jgi:hypothetical protein